MIKIALFLMMIWEGVLGYTGQQLFEDTVFDHFSLQEGLSQSVVTDVTQDHMGFLWIGTQDGLNRYDGFEFEVFRHASADTQSLPANYVQTMICDRAGRLWVGTLAGGLGVAQKGSTAFDRVASTDSRTISVLSLLEREDGSIWVGTGARGIWTCPNPEKPELVPRFLSQALLAGARIWCLLEDEHGGLWIGSDRGLILARGEEDVVSVPPPAPMRPAGVPCMAKDSQGGIWAAHLETLVCHNHQGEFLRQMTPRDEKGASVGLIFKILINARDEAWLGAERGLVRCDLVRESFRVYRHDPTYGRGLSHDQVLSLFQDRSDVLWMGTAGGGLNKLSPQAEAFGTCRSLTLATGEKSPTLNVFSMLEDAVGSLWIGTFDHGLFHFDPSSGKAVSVFPEPPLSHAQITALHQDSTGSLWVGTETFGLIRVTGPDWKDERLGWDARDPQQLPSPRIRMLTADRAGQLWIASEEGGLSRYDAQTDHFVTYQHNPQDASSLICSDVLCLFPDPDHGLWVGTQGYGVEYFDGQVFHHVSMHDPNAQYQANSVVNSIWIDAHHDIWLATDGGLMRISGTPQKPVFHFPAKEHGLADTMVYGVLGDSEENIWVSTNQGLARLDTEEMQATWFDVAHGLQSNEFNQGAFSKGPSGRLFFGGINGLNAFFPHEIVSHDNPPELALKRIKILNQPFQSDQPVSMLEHLELNHQQSVVSFVYVALNFNNPNRNQYAHQLEGFDRDWVFTGNKHDVTYTNLDPGLYRFRVKASSDGHVWSTKPLDLTIRVLPPPWLTWWAYTLYGMLALALAIGIPWFRIRQLKVRERVLAEMVDEKTSELQKANLELGSVNQDLLATTRRLKQTQHNLIEAAHLAGMAEIASTVLHNVGNTLNSLNVSTELLCESLSQSRETALLKDVVATLQQHENDLPEFLQNDPKGQKIPKILELLERRMASSHEVLKTEIRSLKTHIQRIRDIVSDQQPYTRAHQIMERIPLKPFLEELLDAERDWLKKRQIELETQFQDGLFVRVQRFKLINILSHIVRNSVRALQAIDPPRHLKIQMRRAPEGRILIQIEDNGVGMSDQMLQEAFLAGHSTWEGRGLGLHYCGNAIKEMGGEIVADSPGVGKGATFKLFLPQALR